MAECGAGVRTGTPATRVRIQVMALAMLAAPRVSSQRDATILICVAATAYDFGQAANWAAIVDMGGGHAGIALGLINLVGNLGNSIQPYVGARIFHAFGWTTSASMPWRSCWRWRCGRSSIPIVGFMRCSPRLDRVARAAGTFPA